MQQHPISHSPSPWTESIGGVIVAGDGAWIAQLPVDPLPAPFRAPSKHEQDANRRLITTAPRLLADCEAVLAHLERAVHDVIVKLRLPSEQVGTIEDPILERLRRTIAAARDGEQRS